MQCQWYWTSYHLMHPIDWLSVTPTFGYLHEAFKWTSGRNWDSQRRDMILRFLLLWAFPDPSRPFLHGFATRSTDRKINVNFLQRGGICTCVKTEPFVLKGPFWMSKRTNGELGSNTPKQLQNRGKTNKTTIASDWIKMTTNQGEEQQKDNGSIFKWPPVRSPYQTAQTSWRQRMHLYCSQLGASCLQSSSLAFSWVWEFFLTVGAFCLHFRPFCLEWESVSEHLDGL